ncbi:MAG: CPBP family intramembrane metalloprotease [Leptolinea sp.]|nr:CPBP family intramembrane metalloprotease [Leptolinea sp.]
MIGQFIQAMLIAPIINSFFTFGEEFGWRGFLQPTLMPLGERKALVVTGIIWGVWHAPVIAMGHNYGLSYPGFPWTGILGMVWFCVLLGIFLGWLSLRAKNVWPAVIGHAAINGIAGLPVYFSTGDQNPLLGPLPVGIIGSIAFFAVAVWMFWKSKPEPVTTA